MCTVLFAGLLSLNETKADKRPLAGQPVNVSRTERKAQKRLKVLIPALNLSEEQQDQILTVLRKYEGRKLNIEQKTSQNADIECLLTSQQKAAYTVLLKNEVEKERTKKQSKEKRKKKNTQ